MKYFNKKSQATIEYLFILGLGIILILPISVYFFSDFADSNKTNLAEDAVMTVGKTADVVYSLGPGNIRTVQIIIPRGISGQLIRGDEIILYYSKDGKASESFYKTRVNVSGNMPMIEGRYDVRLSMDSQGIIEVNY